MERSKLNHSFSASVQWYRKARNLSADECAKELGISKSTLLNIEQNHANPTLDTVDLIAENMGLDPQFLLFQSNPTSLTAAMLVMKFLGPQNPYGLDTVQQILKHMQAVVDILSSAQTKDISTEE